MPFARNSLAGSGDAGKFRADNRLRRDAGAIASADGGLAREDAGITALDSTGTAMSQQAKHGDAGPGADIDPAVCDHRRNEMPADRCEMISVGSRLVRIVKFL